MIHKVLVVYLILLSRLAYFFADETIYRHFSLDEQKMEVVDLYLGMKKWSSHDYEFSNGGFAFALNYGFTTNQSIKASLDYSAYLRDLWFYFDYAGQALTTSLSYTYMKKLTPVNIFFNSQIQVPIFNSTGSLLATDIFTRGTERVNVGFSIVATGQTKFSTPFEGLFWHGSIQYAVGLPQNEQSYSSWQPGNMQFAGNAMITLTGRIHFLVGLIQNVYLPEITDSTWTEDSPSASTILHERFVFILRNSDFIECTTNISLLPDFLPIQAIITYSHRFKHQD